MKLISKYLIFVLLCFYPTITYSQIKENDKENNKEKNVEDKIYLSPENDYLKDTSSTNRFQGKNIDDVYKKLKGSKSSIVRNFANIILISGDPSIKDIDEEKKEEIHLSENYFKDFEGLIIDSIEIVNKDIYFEEDSMSTGSWLERTVDLLHIQTRKRVIEKYLMFKVGDTVDPLKLSTNEFVLRDLSFISSAYILLKYSDQGGVIVSVFTRDKWTIAVAGELGDYPYLSLYDENFLGTGDKLSISYLHPAKCQKIGGRAEYVARNILGTFIDGRAEIGVGENNRRLNGSLYRRYLYPGDDFWHVGGGYTEKGDGLLTMDSTFYTSYVEASASYGKTFKINPRDESMFLYGEIGAATKRYNKAIETTEYLNPNYYDYSVTGIRVGIAKQNFFQGNMIYGYGNIEDIPYGFKFELTTGWGYSPQAKHYFYYGCQARYGFYKEKVGFFDFTLKGYIKHTLEQDKWQMGSVELVGKYFSPLHEIGKGYYIRNFINVSHTQGINRLYGEREALAFVSPNARIRGITTPIERLGNIRTVVNMESVIFSPLYLLHFRFAGFVWADAGWLGDDGLFWKNKMCLATGVGIRIKNERIIINNLEIRLGYAIKKYPERGYSIFGISNESRLNINTYEPDRVGEYDYR